MGMSTNELVDTVRKGTTAGRGLQVKNSKKQRMLDALRETARGGKVSDMLSGAAARIRTLLKGKKEKK